MVSYGCLAQPFWVHASGAECELQNRAVDELLQQYEVRGLVIPRIESPLSVLAWRSEMVGMWSLRCPFKNECRKVTS